MPCTPGVRSIGDVKPENVLVGAGDHAMLSDFGLARAVEGTRLTQTGGFAASPAYASPEQLRGSDVGPAGDQYALTGVLFTCLTAQEPFPRPDVLAVLMAHASAPRPRVTDRLPGLPSGLDDVVARGMATEPDQRFGSCRELVDAAQSVLLRPESAPTLIAAASPSPLRALQPATLLVPASGGSNPSPHPPAVPVPRWRTWPTVLAMLAIVGVIGALAAISISGRDQGPSQQDGAGSTVPQTAAPPAGPPSSRADRSTTSSLGTSSAAGKPCVALEDPLPPGAPTVPVELGPPPTQLVTRDLRPGTGPAVAAGQTLTVNYIGVSCSTGKIFDSSYKGGKPVSFPLSGVIPGWQKGIPGMRVGGRRLLAIPPGDAYGDSPASSEIAPGETLWFVVDLLDVKAN